MKFLQVLAILLLTSTSVYASDRHMLCGTYDATQKVLEDAGFNTLLAGGFPTNDAFDNEGLKVEIIAYNKDQSEFAAVELDPSKQTACILYVAQKAISGYILIPKQDGKSAINN